MGNTGVIGGGDVQWMTAGSGIIHQEMPKKTKDGLLWGFQLWANLPASRKMMDPRYRDIKNEQIPEIKLEGGVIIRIICGKIGGTEGPVKDIVIDPEYLDVKIPARTEFIHDVKAGHTIFAYVIDGSAYFDEQRDSFAYEIVGANYFDFKRDCLIGAESLIIYGNGSNVRISTANEPVSFLLISGKPIKEPVAWYGPIVMNTQQELRLAFEEYQNGTFIKANG